MVRTPEEDEWHLKQTELAALQERVAAAEEDLQSMHAGLKAFEEEYFRVVAPCLAQMEELKAEAAGVRKPVTEEAESCPSAAQACPPGELKTLFREVAKNIHPDRGANDAERRHRHNVMAHANEAYASGNPERLRDLLQQWKADPDAVQGDDIASRLIRSIRQIARAKGRLHEIRQEIKELRKTDLYFLKQRSERAEAEGRDLLQEMRANLERQILHQRHRVASMQRE